MRHTVVTPNFNNIEDNIFSLEENVAKNANFNVFLNFKILLQYCH